MKRGSEEDGQATKRVRLGLSRSVIKKKIQEEVQEEVKEEEEIKFQSETEKNIYQKNAGSPEVCFFVEFKNTNRSAKQDLKGNGILVIHYDHCILMNMDSKPIGKSDLTRDEVSSKIEDGEESDQVVYIKKKPIYFWPGNTVRIGTKAVTIKFQVPAEEYRSGQVFFRKVQEIEKMHVEETKKSVGGGFFRNMKSKSTGFVTPFKKNAVVKKRERLTKPLHSPREPGAVILFEPKDVFSPNKIHVVVDPVLSKNLRPHQVDGVKFCFECLAGLRSFPGKGCILADDMGLGKTLQAITVIWTLLNQGPTGEPTARKCIIVAPSSLVGNWCEEFKKWLPDLIDPIPMGDANKKKVESALNRFTGHAYDVRNNVLVTSYDQLRIHIQRILKIKDIDLVVCDEGHRLKNAKIKTSIAVSSIPTPRRLLLSGTPIQNDLEEFHAMVDFVNPSILGDIAKFKRLYSDEIDRMRQQDSTEEEKKVGRARAERLSQTTHEFILRRTAKVNQQYLPPKVDNLVFCKLTSLQAKLYALICKRSQTVMYNENSGRKGRETATLAAITHLKKLCNSPNLVHEEYKEEFQDEVNFNPQLYQPQYSGKLQFVDILLASIRATTKDKVVIVSNYTQTLEVLGNMCEAKGYAYFQLDGSTKVSKRQGLVNLFNDPTGPEFIFLLSSKAGGCGLNLVGANHLVLFDPDWNPANDAQAMARVWRPGQQKKVYLYRTLSTGTIEEKVFQRQVAKLSLAANIVEGDTDAVPDFSKNELRELFSYKPNTLCDTHDLLNCSCSKAVNKIPYHKRKAASVDELSNWDHYDHPSKLDKYPLMQKACANSVSFVFAKEEDPKSNKQTKQLVLKKEKLTFSADAGAQEEEEDADYSYVEDEEEKEAVATEPTEMTEEGDDDVDPSEKSEKPEKAKKAKTEKSEKSEKSVESEESEKSEKSKKTEKKTTKRQTKANSKKVSKEEEEESESTSRPVRGRKGNTAKEESDDDEKPVTTRSTAMTEEEDEDLSEKVEIQEEDEKPKKKAAPVVKTTKKKSPRGKKKKDSDSEEEE